MYFTVYDQQAPVTDIEILTYAASHGLCSIIPHSLLARGQDSSTA